MRAAETAQATQSAEPSSVTGFLFAIGSAALFAMSGIFASALMEAGWSAGAAVTVRVLLATAVLAVPTVLALRGQWRMVLAAWQPVLLFGLIAVTLCQLAYYFAVQYIAPSYALLIQYMGPVLLVLWVWARLRSAPHALTVFGACAAVLGLVVVSGIGTGGALHPLGVMFALAAAVGNAVFYVLSADANHGIAPLPLVGLGLGVASVALVVSAAIGVMPFTIGQATPVIAGARIPVAVVLACLALLSTVLAYLLGVAAVRHLGATVASFTGYSEPMFGIVWTILLLAIVPTGAQWIGAALIMAGVVTVKLGEVRQARRRGFTA
ncbi:EamA family transporter [Leucobacter sp. HY1908]